MTIEPVERADAAHRDDHATDDRAPDATTTDGADDGTAGHRRRPSHRAPRPTTSVP